MEIGNKSVFAGRSAKRANKSVPADKLAPDSEEDPEAGEVDYSIMDLNQGPDTPLLPPLLSVYPDQWLSQLALLLHQQPHL